MKKLIILALLGLTLACGTSTNSSANSEPYNIVTLYDNGEVIAFWNFQGYIYEDTYADGYYFYFEGNKVSITGTTIIVTSDKKFEDYPYDSSTK